MINLHLAQACARGDIRLLDLHCGRLLNRLAGDSDPALQLAATLASAATGRGHVCLPLARAGELFPDLAPLMPDSADTWQRELKKCSLVAGPGEEAPLILDRAGNLYLYRYWRREQDVMHRLLEMASRQENPFSEHLDHVLNRLFPDTKAQKKQDPQREAARLAAQRFLTLIAGGPGSGKTYTVARIVALLQHTASGKLRIGLAAPTGKAAARMTESIRQAKTIMDSELARGIAGSAATIHRLLGYHPSNGAFRFHQRNTLHLDLLIIDEASMIDLELMGVLLAALPPSCRLILLGDRFQLAPVEAGSLFGDLCRLADQTPVPGSGGEQLAACVVHLRTSYRFRKKSTIAQLADAINQGSATRVAKLLETGSHDLTWTDGTATPVESWLRTQLSRGFKAVFTAPSIHEAFRALGGFRVLCALRRGSFGAEGVNTLAEILFREQGFGSSGSDIFAGKPIMILRNDYRLNLFNGDTGIVWPDEQGELQVWFQEADNSLRMVPPPQLPDHTAAWAITVHKAQGSEFDEALLLLPDQDIPLLSRELLYTGITRARQKLQVYGSMTVLQGAVARRTVRHSGLPWLLASPVSTTCR